jgi:DNA-directed RNA polymerase specialized sigma24 family protein
VELHSEGLAPQYQGPKPHYAESSENSYGPELCSEHDPLKMLWEADWERLLIPVFAYAHNLLKIRAWRNGGNHLPNGWDARDVVSEAISRVFGRERKWDPDRVDLRGLLLGTVRSLVSHCDSLEEPYQEQALAELADKNGDNSRDPLALLTENEVSDERLRTVLDAVKDDETLKEVLRAIIVAGPKPSDIAAYLTMPTAQVYNLIKRLGRRVLG